MTAWTRKHGLTHDSLGPMTQLRFSDFLEPAKPDVPYSSEYSQASLAAFGKAIAAHPEIAEETVGGLVDGNGDLTDEGKAFIAACASAAKLPAPSGSVSDRVTLAIADHERWAAAGKPQHGFASDGKPLHKRVGEQ